MGTRTTYLLQTYLVYPKPVAATETDNFYSRMDRALSRAGIPTKATTTNVLTTQWQYGSDAFGNETLPELFETHNISTALLGGITYTPGELQDGYAVQLTEPHSAADVSSIQIQGSNTVGLTRNLTANEFQATVTAPGRDTLSLTADRLIDPLGPANGLIRGNYTADVPELTNMSTASQADDLPLSETTPATLETTMELPGDGFAANTQTKPVVPGASDSVTVRTDGPIELSDKLAENGTRSVTGSGFGTGSVTLTAPANTLFVTGSTPLTASDTVTVDGNYNKSPTITVVPGNATDPSSQLFGLGESYTVALNTQTSARLYVAYPYDPTAFDSAAQFQRTMTPLFKQSEYDSFNNLSSGQSAEQLATMEECWRKLNQALGNRLFETLDKSQEAALSALEGVELSKLFTYLCP